MKKGNASALRKGRYSQPNQIFHLVLITYQRQPFFRDYLLARHAVISLRMSQKSVTTLAFVVMPDHIHWLIQLGEGISLSSAVKMLKALISRKQGGKVWQQGFYDHAVRQEEDLVDIARYIILNPVRAGLCRTVREYPWWDSIYLE